MNPVFLRLLVSALLVLPAAGCSVIDPAERTPTYVHIDSIAFVNSPVIGSASQKIGHAYLYYNNQSLGAYDLPCTVPVLTEEGGGTLQVLPGVDLNGLGGYTVPYPFFQADTLRIGHAPGGVLPVAPKTYYNSVARLIWSDAFDGNTQFRYYTGENPEDSLRITSQPGEVFEGSGSGHLRLAPGASTSESATPYTVSIPLVPTSDSYIEINYRGTATLAVGIVTASAAKPEYFLFRPRAGWNKVYIQTRTFVAQHSGGNYNILLAARQPEGSTAGGDVYVDNLKVISY
jgi:hypothetical protein